MPTFYLNSYAPLVASRAGREASLKFNIPPFVDGSIRREPDLEHDYPAITCLCRAGKFAPRLRPNDIVAYMTRRGRYGQDHPQNRLTAVLRVLEAFPNHAAGSKWYVERNLTLPNNCWIRSNPAKPLSQSHRITTVGGCSDSKIHREWDTAYRARSMVYGAFVVCERLWHDLSWNAPEVTERQMLAVFGHRPGTQNPGAWEIKYARRLFRRLKIDDAPCSRPKSQ